MSAADQSPPVSRAPEVDLSEPLGDGWDQPQEVTPLDLAFPARGVELTPAWESIPAEFREQWNGGNEWTAFVDSWFSRGWPKDVLVYPRPDVDPERASGHVQVVLGCYGLKHEHKLAGAGWLMSRWFGALRPSEVAS